MGGNGGENDREPQVTPYGGEGEWGSGGYAVNVYRAKGIESK